MIEHPDPYVRGLRAGIHMAEGKVLHAFLMLDRQHIQGATHIYIPVDIRHVILDCIRAALKEIEA